MRSDVRLKKTIDRASESTLATTGSSAASGRRARMRATRSRTSAAAASTLRSMRNSMTTWLRSSRLWEVIARTPSMPETTLSTSSVMRLSMTSFEAPL